MGALAAIRKRIPYFGVCLTDKHKEMLQLRLETLCFQEMKKEDGSLHEPALVKMLEGQGEKRPLAVAKPKAQGRKPKQAKTEAGDDDPALLRSLTVRKVIETWRRVHCRSPRYRIPI